MKITVKDLKALLRKGLLGEAKMCEDCGMPMEGCDCEKVSEVAPPGREKQVKKLKKTPGIENPWAIAWSQQNKHGKPGKGK